MLLQLQGVRTLCKNLHYTRRNASGYFRDKSNKRQGGPASPGGNAPKGLAVPGGNAPKGPRIRYAPNNNWVTGNGGWAAEGSGSEVTEVDHRDKTWVLECGGGTSSSTPGWRSVSKGR